MRENWRHLLTSPASTTPSAAAVVLVLLSVALRGVIGARLLSIALLLAAIARLGPIASTLGLPIATALRTATVTMEEEKEKCQHVQNLLSLLYIPFSEL